MKKTLFFILIVILTGFVYFINKVQTYPIYKYFPLNENDKYIYIRHENAKKGIVTIIVKNVKQINKEEKQFDFFWKGENNNQGQESDRIQTNRLTSKGIVFYSNKHLVGEIPLKSIRILSPPLIMIPGTLKKNINLSTLYSTYSYEGKLLEQEKIEEDISFIGFEEVTVDAGTFPCIHFFVRHIYKDWKDPSGKSKHMHTYNFWIAPNVGIVKFIHTFIQFIYIQYFTPEDINLMNRYNGTFVETFDLKKAIIGGKVIEQ